MNAVLDRITAAAAPVRYGSVSRVVGLSVDVTGLVPALGEHVVIRTAAGLVNAEAVSIRQDGATCLPLGDLDGVRVGDEAHLTGGPILVPVGAGLLGRILDGLGNPLDGLPLPYDTPLVPASGTPPHPLRRARVDEQLPLGVKVMDTLVPCGRGQRIGIFAGSGVGKSTLLSMIARGTEADVSVIALVGERGREVREFIENDLGPEGLARSVVVVATSDEPALVRRQAAYTATRIAESFRDAGRDVVLMMDSVTRFAMAQREVGLSAGEPPTTRGYPPSVFGLLPKLLERAGAGESGSITGLYTVLVDGDDMDEPIADAARSILDGHVVLSRRLASEGHFPTVEVLDSVSRVSGAITDNQQAAAAREIRRLLAAYKDAKDLIEVGAYVSGTNPTVDRAVALKDDIRDFLTQRVDEQVPASMSWTMLANLAGAEA